MPIYEYRCSSCGHELETLQKFSDPALVACPACHRDALVKLISAAGFQLKGTGWYATDFRGSGAKPAAKAAEGDTKPTEGKADTKTETAAAKPDPSGSGKSDASGPAKPASASVPPATP